MTAIRRVDGRQRLDTAIRRAVAENLRPPPKLTLSEWAERHAVLSRETSAQTGRWRSFGYQPGIMDAITDPANAEVIVMKSARVGYTKILDHTVGYFVHQDPSPIMVVQPRVEDAEDYSKTEIAPMLRDTPVLSEIVGDVKAKDGDNTILKKVFRNGSSLTLTGANSPGGFRRITVRVVLFDEVDGYPAGGAGSEGDQIALGIKRSETFWNRRIVMGSTPTVKGISRIERAWLQSDMRKYFVPCPHCGEMQALEWGGKDAAHGIKWRQDERGNHLPETTVYVCVNGCIIEESEKPRMIERGEWRATAPFKGRAGFHIWAGYSLFPNAAWSKLVEEWLRVKGDPLARQTFVNLVLGLPYEDRGEGALDEHKLAARREVYPAEVPDGVAVVTVGADVQADRLEVEVVGWGRDEESWSIAYETIEGDPDEPDTWKRFDDFLKRKWSRRDGRSFEVMAACVDSGGHHTQKVYSFAKDRIGRRVWAIKGEAARGGARSPVWPTKRPTSKTKKSYRPIILGVNAAKDVVRNRLRIEEPGPGYSHFPVDRDINYFAQLVSERSVAKQMGAQRYRVWELPPGRANEALDCRVYAYGALCGLMHFGLRLNRWADKTAEDLPEPAPSPETPDPMPMAQPEAKAPPQAVAARDRARRMVRRLAGA